MTVGELLRRVSSRELSEWMVYARLEPFGEERSDWRSGMVAATVANVNRDPKKGKAFQPEDFIPRFETDDGRRTTDDATHPKSASEVYSRFRSWALLSKKKKS